MRSVMPSTRKFATATFVLLCGAGLVLALLGIYRFSSYKNGIVEPLREDLVRTNP